MASNKTVIVTGAFQGIGAGFLSHGYNFVATSRGVSKARFALSANLTVVNGDIGHSATVERSSRLP